MAIETAGKRPVKPGKVKIENQVSFELPKNTDEQIEKIMDFLSTEHTRGIEKIKLVDFINTASLKNMNVPVKGDLPALYHPKVANQNAYLEISAGALLQPTEGFAKKLMAKQSFKSSLASVLFSLVGQHYYFTLRHSVKKNNLEPQIRQYAERNMKAWSEYQVANDNSLRAKIFKPFRPLMEKLAKWLNKKAVQAQKSA